MSSDAGFQSGFDPETLRLQLVFNKTVAVKQLHVVEAHGILLFQADKGTCEILLPVSTICVSVVQTFVLFCYGQSDIYKRVCVLWLWAFMSSVATHTNQTACF
jgi:hypothetical protein